MIVAEQRLDFLRYRGRTFVDVAGLLLWLWKQHKRALELDECEQADGIFAIIQRIEQDTP